uniref:Gp28/Gp37-like domain-containing protein n=1 Tax=Dulem virus 36 TaxID=3145754 RepID=A0AAU8B197_9CAUD
MIIYVLDKNFKKIDILRKYTFAQYSNKARDIGTFSIQCQIAEEVLYLLNKEQYYVLFDNSLLGKIEDIHRDSDSEYVKTIEITGRLDKYIFANRVIDGTYKAQNVKSHVFVSNVISKYLSNENERFIDYVLVREDRDRLDAMSLTISKQVTGGYIWDAIQPIMEQSKIFVRMEPQVIPTDTVNGVPTNIEGWNIVISAGVDKTKRNTLGNKPVVFSHSLSNIARTEYRYNVENYKGVAYIAGEDSGNDRKWYSKYVDTSAESETGWNRSELWIDARDIQSENEDGTTITDAEYEELITDRANEKFAENTKTEEYSATVITADKRYVYGTDYNLGDFITIVDNELGLEVDAQIISVIKSVQDTGTIIDVECAYGSLHKNNDVKQTLSSLKAATENNAVNIKYLENKIGSSSGGSGSAASVQTDVYNIALLGAKEGSENQATNKAILDEIVSKHTEEDGIWTEIYIPAGKIYYIGTVYLTHSKIRVTGGGVVCGKFYVRKTENDSYKSYIEFDNITFWFDSLASGNNAISMRLVSRARIVNCRFYNCDKAINCFQTETKQHVSRVIIANNYFYNVNYALIHERGIGTPDLAIADIQFENNMVENALYYHIYLECIDGVIIKGNTFFFPSHTTANTTKKCNIYLYQVDWTIIADNNLFEAGEQAILVKRASHVNIHGNNIAWSGQRAQLPAIQLSNKDNAGGIMSGSTIMGNNIVYPSAEGILVQDTGCVTVIGNTCYECCNDSYYYGTTTFDSSTHDYGIKTDVSESAFVHTIGNNSPRNYNSIVSGATSRSTDITNLSYNTKAYSPNYDEHVTVEITIKQGKKISDVYNLGSIIVAATIIYTDAMYYLPAMVCINNTGNLQLVAQTEASQDYTYSVKVLFRQGK